MSQLLTYHDRIEMDAETQMPHRTVVVCALGQAIGTYCVHSDDPTSGDWRSPFGFMLDEMLCGNLGLSPRKGHDIVFKNEDGAPVTGSRNFTFPAESVFRLWLESVAHEFLYKAEKKGHGLMANTPDNWMESADEARQHIPWSELKRRADEWEKGFKAE